MATPAREPTGRALPGRPMSSLALEVGGIPLGVIWTWMLMAFATGFGLGLIVKALIGRFHRRRARRA